MKPNNVANIESFTANNISNNFYNHVNEDIGSHYRPLFLTIDRCSKKAFTDFIGNNILSFTKWAITEIVERFRHKNKQEQIEDLQTLIRETKVHLRELELILANNRSSVNKINDSNEHIRTIIYNYQLVIKQAEKDLEKLTSKSTKKRYSSAFYPG